MINRILALMLFACLGSVSIGQSIDDEQYRCDRADDYAAGYRLALAQRRPLLVFLTGENCGACKVAKREVIEPMIKADELANCVIVDVMVESSEGQAMKVHSYVPQIMIYEWGDGEPVRYLLKKNVKITRDRVIELIERLKRKEVK